MLIWKGLLGLSLSALTYGGYYQYQHSHSFRSVCNLIYAGSHMAYIYKFSSYPISQKHTTACQYLRDAVKSNGGIYLKLGQLIATLDVIVPDQYRSVMNTLTRQCQEEPFEEIKKTVEEDLGYPLDVVFREFDKKSISSASIAQVHRARLLNGEEVAVKVQHRALQSQVESDLEMMWRFVDVAKWLFKDFNYEWLVEGFDKNIRIQLDFKREAANMKRTSNFLQQNNFKNIHVPELFLNTTKRVLIMQYIHGVHIDQLQQLHKMKVNTKRLSSLFSQMIIKMIHKEGFVHADTHSGNLMVRKYKKKDQLVLLDHGLYQQMDKKLVRNYNQFWLGLILNDASLFQKAGRQLGTTNPRMLRQMLTSKSEQDLNNLNRNIFDLNPSKDREKIMAQAAKNHSKIVSVLEQLKREILLLLKVNQFARSIQNMMSGREMGVYEDIAKECVQNMGFSWPTRWRFYISMWLSNR